MPAAPIQGQKTILQYNTSGSTYVTIAAVKKINNFLGIKTDSIETTTLDDSIQEWTPSDAPDPGTANFDLQYDPSDSTHAAFWTKCMTTPQTANTNFKLTLANSTASTYTFSAHITDFGLSGFERGSVIMAGVDMKISGAVTLTV